MLCAELSEIKISHRNNRIFCFRVHIARLLFVSHLAVLHQMAVGRDCGKSQPAPTETATASRTGVPTMHLSGSNILIVGEAPGTLELRERLIASGANVQVVSVAGASIAISQKQIDGAFIGASLDEDTRQLCAELSALEIAQIFIAPGRAAPLYPAIARGVGLNVLRRKMRMSAHT